MLGVLIAALATMVCLSIFLVAVALIDHYQQKDFIHWLRVELSRVQRECDALQGFGDKP